MAADVIGGRGVVVRFVSVYICECVRFSISMLCVPDMSSASDLSCIVSFTVSVSVAVGCEWIDRSIVRNACVTS